MSDEQGDRRIDYARVADSGMERLVELLHRFLARDIRGRLVLVGSAPGTGKTSMLNRAATAASKRFQARQPADQGAGVLLVVPVDGVSFFGPTTPAATPPTPEAAPAAGAADNAADKKDKQAGPQDPELQMLVTLVQALHAALVRDVARKLGQRGAGEAAEQFRVDMLRGEVELPRIREAWERARALPEGLYPAGDGWQELSTLWNLGRAYMVTSGVAAASRKAQSKTGFEESFDGSLSLPVQKLLGPTLALLAGGALGAELFPESPLGKFATVVVGALAGTLSWTRKQTRSGDVDRTAAFAETLDVPALGRWLPVILQQLKDIGVFTVFLVDEVRIEDPKDLLGRLATCRAFSNHGAFVALLTDHVSYRRAAECKAPDVRLALQTLLADEVFLSFPPGALRDALIRGGTQAGRAEELVYQGRSRPLSIDLLARSGTVSSGRVDYAEAVVAALATHPWSSRFGRAWATDLLYAPAERWEAGERELRLDDDALMRWSRRAGWQPAEGAEAEPVEPPDPMLVDVRDQWIEALEARGMLVRMAPGTARWRIGPAGQPLPWFATLAEARAWLDSVQAAAGAPLRTVCTYASVTYVDTPLELADNLVVARAELAGLIVCGNVLAMLARGSATVVPGDVAAALDEWINSLRASAEETWAARATALVELVGAPAPTALFAATPADWHAGLASFAATLSAAKVARSGTRGVFAEAAKAYWTDRIALLRDGRPTPPIPVRCVAWGAVDADARVLARYVRTGRTVHDWSPMVIDGSWSAEPAQALLGAENETTPFLAVRVGRFHDGPTAAWPAPGATCDRPTLVTTALVWEWLPVDEVWWDTTTVSVEVIASELDHLKLPPRRGLIGVGEPSAEIKEFATRRALPYVPAGLDAATTLQAMTASRP